MAHLIRGLAKGLATSGLVVMATMAHMQVAQASVASASLTDIKFTLSGVNASFEFAPGASSVSVALFQDGTWPGENVQSVNGAFTPISTSLGLSPTLPNSQLTASVAANSLVSSATTLDNYDDFGASSVVSADLYHGGVFKLSPHSVLEVTALAKASIQLSDASYLPFGKTENFVASASMAFKDYDGQQYSRVGLDIYRSTADGLDKLSAEQPLTIRITNSSDSTLMGALTMGTNVSALAVGPAGAVPEPDVVILVALGLAVVWGAPKIRSRT